MNKWVKIGILVVSAIVIVGVISVAFFTRGIAHDIIYHPAAERPEIEQTPTDFGMAFEEVTVTTEDGLNLTGWYVPGTNGATVIAQHGSPGPMPDSLYEAAFLNKHGYNVLLSCFRAHGASDGELISFGYHEQKDLDAWYNYLLTRDDVDPERIGIFGESMGGGTAILYAAHNDGLKAVATGSAYSLSQDTIETFIQFEQPDLPHWAVPLLASSILFWAEREWGFSVDALDTAAVIGNISPRPILIIHGGADAKVGSDDGQMLYDAAREPKELWLVPKAGHVDFEQFEPVAYEQHLIVFFDDNLLKP